MEVILLEWKSWWVFYPTQNHFLVSEKYQQILIIAGTELVHFVQMSQVFTKNIPLIYNCKNDN
jgi:hypothetical protein